MTENKIYLWFKNRENASWFFLIIAGISLGLVVSGNPKWASIIVIAGCFSLLAIVFPEQVAWLALISVAISPQYIISTKILGIEVSSLHKLFILYALIPYLLTRGVRKIINPPIIAYLIILTYTFILSSRPEFLDTVQPFKSFIGLTTAWFIFSLNWNPRRIPKYIHGIGSLAIINVLIGIALHLLRIKPVYAQEYTGAFRLTGSTIAAHLAMLAFIGIAAAMGEAARGKKNFLWLGLLNFGILAATGTRGATLGALLLFLPFSLRQLTHLIHGKIAVRVLQASLIAGVIFVVALPNFITRVAGNQWENGINTSGRLEAWTFFFQQANQNPWFGRGLGAGTVLNQGQINSSFRVPHNEYLRTYVDGGIIGSILVSGAFILLFHEILSKIRPKARPYLMSLILGFLIYSFFDNTLSTTQFAVPFGWYLAIYYTRERYESFKASLSVKKPGLNELAHT
jgi:teichuronic acid biosynthesis protein TuaE